MADGNDAPVPVPGKVHYICVLDHTGDTRQQWDPNKPDEVEAARATFDKMRKKGYAAYKVDKDKPTEKGEVIRDFDPQAGMMILAPPMAGG